MPKPVTVRAQALGGQWETIGVDRSAGIWAEALTLESDWWGPSKASFTLKRDARRAFPDLSTYTPIDVLVGEKPVWAGRTGETPTDGTRSLSVQCDGAQYHLDDDLYEKFYVHSRLGDWKDTRTLLGVNLVNMPNRLSEQAGDGMVVLGCAKGTEWTSNTGVGITLDLGPAASVEAMSYIFDRYSNATVTGSSLYLYARVSATPDPLVAPFAELTPRPLATTTGATVADTFPSARRYVHLFVWNTGSTFTAGDDVTVRIKAATVYADSDYLNVAGFAQLKASDVLGDDAFIAATPLLSADRSRIAATSTNLNDFYVQGPKAPREYATNANAYHNYKIGVDARRRMVFQPRPSTPIYEIGEWSGASISDLSANSGDAIYDRVIVQSTAPDGTPVRVTRSASASTATVRRGFHRTKTLDVGFALPTDGALAAAIGDAWLGQNHLTPMKGTIKVGAGDVRNILTGETVGLEDLLGVSHELIRLMDRRDPDTGGWGRDARIAGAKWNPATEQAEITIDNTRANFEALLARLAIVGGG